MKEYDPLKPEREHRTLTEEERARFAEALRRAVKKPPAMASKAAAEDGDDRRVALAVEGFPHRVQTEVSRQGVGEPPGVKDHGSVVFATD